MDRRCPFVPLVDAVATKSSGDRVNRTLSLKYVVMKSILSLVSFNLQSAWLHTTTTTLPTEQVHKSLLLEMPKQNPLSQKKVSTSSQTRNQPSNGPGGCSRAMRLATSRKSSSDFILWGFRLLGRETSWLQAA